MQIFTISLDSMDPKHVLPFLVVPEMMLTAYCAKFSVWLKGQQRLLTKLLKITSKLTSSNQPIAHGQPSMCFSPANTRYWFRVWFPCRRYTLLMSLELNLTYKGALSQRVQDTLHNYFTQQSAESHTCTVYEVVS